MKSKGVDTKDERIWLGQLYMSDNISYNLADHNIYCKIFFWSSKDVMPYLIRRAEENTSVAGQTSRELGLINAEQKKKEKRINSCREKKFR
jgi:proline dehydrogenase